MQVDYGVLWSFYHVQVFIMYSTYYHPRPNKKKKISIKLRDMWVWNNVPTSFVKGNLKQGRKSDQCVSRLVVETVALSAVVLLPKSRKNFVKAAKSTFSVYNQS